MDIQIMMYFLFFFSGFIIGKPLGALTARMLQKDNAAAAPILLIEGVNGSLYLSVYWRYGVSIECILYCLLFSALLALSVIDFRTYEIPVEFNVFVLILGIIRIAAEPQGRQDYVIGFFSVSVVLFILYVVTKGRGIGGGDVKLMAVCGTLLGWKLNILAFLWGCILGSVIHLLRMKFSGQGNVLALGPYLSMGIVLAVLFGNQWITWYFTLLQF